MPDEPARNRTWVAAAVLDGLAVVALILLGVGSYLGFGPGFLLFSIGGLLGLAVIPAVVVSSLWTARLLGRRGVHRGIIAAVLVGSALAAVVAAPIVVGVSSSLTPNPAADRLQPLVDELDAVGGSRICDDGDPGLGPDNTRPWKVVYYRVPIQPGLEQRLRQVAARSGLTSSADPSGAELGLTVTSKPIELDCPGGAWGRRYTPGHNEATVVANLQLPVRGE